MVAVDSSASSPIPGANESEYITIATIGKPVGLKGWCRLFPFGNTLERGNVPRTFMVGNNRPQTSVRLEKLEVDPKGYRGFFTGYESYEKIEELKNCSLFIEQQQLPATDNGEYYHFELKGMGVYSDISDDCIGTVVEVHNYPTVDALEIEGKNGATILIPMNPAAIKLIERKSRRIVIDKGVLEELL